MINEKLKECEFYFHHIALQLVLGTFKKCKVLFSLSIRESSFLDNLSRFPAYSFKSVLPMNEPTGLEIIIE